ncbi:MAG TPA: peptidoglycan-binding domain-containing protein [Bacteroidales bacterium]|jgi:hypothetical protein|nr:peptidoglycan-binding domain-containing protein [Bacteroidales bacterium]HQN16677.1 peptidoglycan-binding domain-containing protein [Bacteroidales bacterium]HQP16244.1 peptidoglycan-binding domain-containing protein [Bacteroidales bacterium]
MKNKTPILIFIVIIALIATAIFLFKDKIFGKPDKAEDDKENKTTASGTAPSSNNEFPLKNGTKGLKVKQLQAGLNILKKTNLNIDGKFGPKTEKALKKHFGITKLTEYDYDKYVYPYLAQINAEINKNSSFSGEDFLGKKAYSSNAETRIFQANKIFGIGDFLRIGEVKGYTVDTENHFPAGISGTLLGDIIGIEGEYYLISDPEGATYFVLKSESVIA